MIVLHVLVDGCEHVVMSVYLSGCQNMQSQRLLGLKDEEKNREGRLGLFGILLLLWVTRYKSKHSNFSFIGVVKYV